MSFSEKIQILRKQKGISQEQLAEMLDISRQAVSKWELGESLPDVENIVKLSEIFGVSTDYLMKHESPQASAWESTTESRSSFDFDDEEDSGGGFAFNLRGVLTPLATLAFLVMGFYWNLWHPGWVVFVAAWLIGQVIDFFQTGNLKISFYGIAGILFIILGFIFGAWAYLWLLFIVAWVFDSAFKRSKPKKKKKKKS